VTRWREVAHQLDETPTLVRWGGLWAIGPEGVDALTKAAQGVGADPLAFAYAHKGEVLAMAQVPPHEADEVLAALAGKVELIEGE
jgi:hypothetical protein